jgi:hypothetical protein
MPDAGWPAIGPSANLVPEKSHFPGFDIISTLSTRHQWFACARLSGPYLTGQARLFRNAQHHGF